MALTYGFYNSQNGDRVYDADQFSSFLDGIVYDGVYEAVGDKFYVTSLEDEDLTIQVGAGRAWLKHTWTLNDTNLYLNATAALDVYDRIDAVILEVDKEIRTNSIKIIEGTPSDATPARPDLKNEDNIRQYPLAYIYREHGTTTIPNTHAGTLETDAESATECIKFMVGSSSMPLCSALALAGIPSGGKIGQVLAKSTTESAAVGWYDIDRLPRGDQWYIVNGITEDNVIAAWRFKGRETEAEALTNVNQNGDWILTNTGCTWTTGKGFYMPATVNCYLTNSTLISSKGSFMMSCAIGYSDMTAAGTATGGVYPIKGKALCPLGILKKANSDYTGYIYTAKNHSVNGYQSGTVYTEGVLSCNWDSSVKLYHDGLQMALSNDGGSNCITVGRCYTTLSEAKYLGHINIFALVFYNSVLSDAQHLRLAEQINAL